MEIMKAKMLVAREKEKKAKELGAKAKSKAKEKEAQVEKRQMRDSTSKRKPDTYTEPADLEPEVVDSSASKSKK